MQFRSQSPHHDPPACSPDVDIRGFCLPGFGEGVAEAMRANMRAGQEIGASFAAGRRPAGRRHLGRSSGPRRRAWEQDTLVCVRSVTKARERDTTTDAGRSRRARTRSPCCRVLERLWSAGQIGHHGGAPALLKPCGIPYLDALAGGFWDPDRVCEAIEAQQPGPQARCLVTTRFRSGLIYQG